MLRMRERFLTPLQERFIRLGFKGFSDREIIELFLSLALSYRECQKLAKKCFARFKDFSEFLAASPQELERVGINPHFMFCIKLLRELPAEVLKKEIIGQFFLSPHRRFLITSTTQCETLRKRYLRLSI